ncbi:Tim44 domain-containing protein [Sphingomonas sabuli]|uniref:Tim44 domain-containing protein n=1 Tax=Sphingomonas sabuli TaxID=2764186 RepID=A0A7G9L2Q8_9SPHN|nr:Tim44/TimA family putative adaptor protein [Sphingomonas sabuli]QNM82907.1 Tim44 domain-containing protein [Sphingomonas sabuli]
MTVIIILALVALFVGLRLYSVLGERTGHEQQPILKPADPDAARVERPAPPVAGVQPAQVDSADLAYLPTAGPGVRALLAADQTFDVARFLDGAKSAYRMILEAFWAGELEKVRPFVDDSVYNAFASSIDQRNAQGLVLDNRLVTIEQALIAEAALEHSVAFVTVRFEADIAAVTRNKEGEVVAGAMSDAVQTRDLWTFRRDTATNDPNWLLVETDEEE